MIIDPAAIQNLRALSPGDDDEFVREIVGIFAADTPGRLAELEQSQRSGDLEKFTRAAHSVKGSASNVGAVTLRTLAEQVEREAREGQLGTLAPAVAELRRAFDLALRELEQL